MRARSFMYRTRADAHACVLVSVTELPTFPLRRLRTRDFITKFQSVCVDFTSLTRTLLKPKINLVLLSPCLTVNDSHWPVATHIPHLFQSSMIGDY